MSWYLGIRTEQYSAEVSTQHDCKQHFLLHAVGQSEKSGRQLWSELLVEVPTTA